MSGPSDKRSRSIPPEVSCNGKVGFAGYTQAAAVAGRQQSKERPKRTAYQCAYCGLWHLGTDKGRVEKAKRREYKERRSNG